MGCERVPASAILAHTCCTVQKWMGSHSSTRRTVWLVARSSRENGVIRARLALSWARSPRTLRMRHRGPADSLGDQGRRGRVRGGRRGPRGPGRVPAGPVAVRAPQPGPRSRVRAVPGPAAPRPGESGTAGGPYADRASRTGPADADGRDGTAPPPPRPVSVPGRTPRPAPCARPARRTLARAPGGRAAVPGERATASARQPAKAETPGRALARPGLSGSSVIVSPLAAAGHRRREHASRLRRRHAAGWLPGIKYLAGREPVFVLGDE